MAEQSFEETLSEYLALHISRDELLAKYNADKQAYALEVLTEIRKGAVIARDKGNDMDMVFDDIDQAIAKVKGTQE